MHELPFKIRILRKARAEMFTEDAVSLPLYWHWYEKKKVNNFLQGFLWSAHQSCPEYFQECLNSILTQLIYPLLSYSLPSGGCLWSESLSGSLFTVLCVFLHICTAHLVLKKSKETHVSSGVVMRLCITRGTFFWCTSLSNPLTPAQTGFLKQSVLLKCFILKGFLCYTDVLKNFYSISK